MVFVLAIILVYSFVLSSQNVIGRTYNLNNNLKTNGVIHQESFVDNDYWPLGTELLPVGSIIQVNYTVLPNSNSSVFFRYIYYLTNDTIWSPTPSNYTLAPGESFEGTFTLMKGMTSKLAELGFHAIVSDRLTNSTVHWWYEVLVTGKVPTAGFFVFGSSLLLLSFGIKIHSIRLQQVKGWKKKDEN